MVFQTAAAKSLAANTIRILGVNTGGRVFLRFGCPELLRFTHA